MNNNQRVSVIIPNYNHAPYLKQRIDSVLNQTYQNFEVIILDDCSVDTSREIIEEYRNNKKISSIVFNEKNSGSTFKQWNKGVGLAKGDIIWIAESDDVADKDFLKSLVPHFEDDPNVGIVYCQSYRYNSNNKITGNWKSWTDDLDSLSFSNEFKMEGIKYIKQYLLFKNTIPNASAVLFRKDLYQQIGGADEKVFTCSDWLTWLKILSISNIVYIPAMLNYFRYHEKSVIATVLNNSENIYIRRFLRIARENFHEHFKSNKMIMNDYKDIYYKNWNFLIQEYEQEGLFEIHRKNLLTGWLQIVRAAFSNGVKVRIILRAIKKMLSITLNRISASGCV